MMAGLGIFGGICFLTMGLPILLAVGLAGLLSPSVWLPLGTAVIGVGVLAASLARSGRCRRCALAPEDAAPRTDVFAPRGGHR